MRKPDVDLVKLATVDQLKPGSFFAVEHDGEPIALYNVNGTIYATRNECSHDGGTLTGGWMEGACVVCPRHGAKFDVASGKATALPAVISIDTYPVKVEGNDIYVELEV